MLGCFRKAKVQAALWLLYVVAVLSIDTLIDNSSTFLIQWGKLDSSLPNGFETFKFITWLVIPLALTLRKIDAGYFTFSRWQRRDWLILAALALAGLIIMLLIPHFPGVRNVYPSLRHLSASKKLARIQHNLIWTFSWLLGREFMHRYALLIRLRAAWPRCGWLLIPLIEGAFHFQKPPIELLLMVVFSLFFTPWAIRRQNALLPFLAHLIIELELLAFMLIV